MRAKKYPEEIMVGVNFSGELQIVREFADFWAGFRAQKPARYVLALNPKVKRGQKAVVTTKVPPPPPAMPEKPDNQPQTQPEALPTTIKSEPTIEKEMNTAFHHRKRQTKEGVWKCLENDCGHNFDKPTKNSDGKARCPKCQSTNIA
jgi:predicted Zn-ribbon and HTH transcriptional regulator